MGDDDIVAHAHALEDRRFLEGADHARRATRCGARPEIRSPLKVTLPDVGLTKEAISLNSVDLPAPFGPMTRQDLALAQAERDVVDGDQPAVALGEVLDLQDALVHQRVRLAAAHRRRG